MAHYLNPWSWYQILFPFLAFNLLLLPMAPREWKSLAMACHSESTTLWALYGSLSKICHAIVPWLLFDNTNRESRERENFVLELYLFNSSIVAYNVLSTMLVDENGNFRKFDEKLSHAPAFHPFLKFLKNPSQGTPIFSFLPLCLMYPNEELSASFHYFPFHPLLFLSINPCEST